MQQPTTGQAEPDPARYPAKHSEEHRLHPAQHTGLPLRSGNGNADRIGQLTHALGWFSVGLGLMQLLAPRTVARASGVEDHPVLLRAIGMRELASGVGILNRRQPGGWLWSRVAGDAMDLALLAVAGASSGAARKRVALAATAVAGVTALDVLAGVENSRRNSAGYARHAGRDVDLEKSIAVNRPTVECYYVWRDFQNFPRFMSHLESVHPLSDTRFHWIARGPGGDRVEWDTDILIDRPGQILAWQSVDDAEVQHAGVVRFDPAPHGRGTLVKVEMQYRPLPGGLLDRMFGAESAGQMEDDLRRFKQLVETGEIATTEGQSAGRRSPIMRFWQRVTG